MNAKLDFLREYNENIRFVSPDEVKAAAHPIPETWKEIFSEQDNVNRIQKMLSIWKQLVGTYLRNTILYLQEYLEDIELVEDHGTFSVLYTIKNRNGEMLYYEGRNPLFDFENEELESAWVKIPESIRNFYENLHNGFFDFTSESMGLVPIDSVTYLGDEDLEWDIINELEKPIQIHLETSFGFFDNGMGSYVAIDYSNCDKDNAAFWSAKKQPRYNVNFWSYVDEWIVIGFE